MRVNPHEIHVNEPEFYEKLYNFSPELDKDPLHAREIGMQHNIQGTAEFVIHKRRKAAFGVYFSRMQITRIEGLIHAYANKLCDAIRKQKAEEGTVLMRYGINLQSCGPSAEQVLTPFTVSCTDVSQARSFVNIASQDLTGFLKTYRRRRIC